MNHRLLISCLVAMSLLAGCIPSLNPVYLPEDLITDPNLVGVWMQRGEKTRWEFAEGDKKSYSLRYFDEEGREGRFIAHLAKIEGELFLDLFPEPIDSKANSFHSFHHVPVHTIYRVYRIGPTVELGAIDFQWLDDELKGEPAAIQSTTFHGRHLLTAPTEDVRAFAVKSKDHFTARIELSRAPNQRQNER